ncbi:hypothetical protein RV18_GL002607 [Enterococcus termitis]|nr:hypothetical protein RV18_GL002607 [Enterococcus termitis]
MIIEQKKKDERIRLSWVDLKRAKSKGEEISIIDTEFQKI